MGKLGYYDLCKVTLRDANIDQRREECVPGKQKAPPPPQPQQQQQQQEEQRQEHEQEARQTPAIERPQAISSNIKRSKKHATTQQPSNKATNLHVYTEPPPFPKPPEEFPRWAIKTWVFLDPNPKVLWRSTWRKGPLTSTWRSGWKK